MNRILFGRKILLGREQEQSRLFVALMFGNQPKAAPLGTAGSVPQSVSRCQPKEGKAHCSIEIDDTGKMYVTNLKSQNITCVNGLEVNTKRLNEGDSLTLGCDHFPIDLNAVFDVAARIVNKVEPPPPPEFNIDHLKPMWETFQKEQLDDEIRRNRNAQMGRLPMVFTMSSGALSALSAAQGWKITPITLVLTGLGLVLMVYFFIKGMKDDSATRRRERAAAFKKNYVCPNPECGYSLKNFEFEDLIKQKKCPKCGCIWKSNL